MPDAMDRLQQEALDHASDAVAAHADRPRSLGLSHCEREECGEAIAANRTAMGARLCIECQKEVEARAAHFRTWGRR